jgi:hypothetical protein
MSTSTPENRRKTGKQIPGSEVTRFKPGQSGNPGGRPKTAPLSQACRELLADSVPNDREGRTYAQAIAQTLGEKALAGDIRAAQELADRAEGKARQSIEIEHTALRKAFERLNEAELQAYAVSGELPDWFQREANDAIQ